VFPRPPPEQTPLPERIVGHVFKCTAGNQMQWVALPEVARVLSIADERRFAKAVERARIKGWLAIDEARPRRVCLTAVGRSFVEAASK
jgi:hypothetical protein